MENEYKEEQLDLTLLAARFFHAFKRMFILVLVLAILGGGYYWMKAKRSFVPCYQSRAVFSVSSGYGTEDILSYSYYYDNVAASQLADTFQYILTTDLMREMILQHLDKPYINGSISSSSVASTNMLVLTVQSSDPQDAHDVLQAVIDSYPQVACYMVENAQVTIRNSPSMPTEPFNSFSGKRPLMKGAATGLILGLILVLIRALLSQSIHSADELKKMVNMNVLAVLPWVNVKKRRKGSEDQVSIDESYMETVRGARIKMLKGLPEKGGGIFLITSTLAGEGKSTFSVAMARSLVRDGKRVILVDADIRKQGLRSKLNLQENTRGLLDYLTKKELKPAQCILKLEEGFDLVVGMETTSTRLVPDYSRISSFFDELRKQYDVILVDSAPCGIVSDTASLVTYAHGVIYLVRQDYVPRNRVLDGVQSLYSKGAVFTGCVLNGVNRAHRKGYGYGYGYGYGRYGKKKKKEKA